MRAFRWDIFCRVIDNYGDIGVCWRLARALAGRGQQVRLWADDLSALAWMAPQGCAGVQTRLWQPDAAMPPDVRPADVVIEAFGCDIDHHWIAMHSGAISLDSARAGGQNSSPNQPIWINLEYLSAEPYVLRCHGLRSPVLSGPAAGLAKWFFYPGFEAGTGGLLPVSTRVTDGPPQVLPVPANARRVSLFCYEPPALGNLLEQLGGQDRATQLRVLAGRGQAALKAVMERKNASQPSWNQHSLLSIQELLPICQSEFDALLLQSDLNFVRGEDSLVSALRAGRAFVWQIYPQQDGAHAAKLEAFLDWLQAPPSLRQFHAVWNGLSTAPLPPLQWEEWTHCAHAARQRLALQADLVSQLLDFVEEKRRS
jgi:uncharacterized repeat protein (TIGR03837 family)